MGLARGLDTTEEWLLHARGAKEGSQIASASSSTLDVPLISWVSAGNLSAPDAINDIRDAPRVSFPDLDSGGDWIALRVDGDSMDRISPPDSIIAVNLKDKRLVANACYVIADDAGGATYKRYRPPGEWAPVSTNPEHQPMRHRAGQGPHIIGRVRKSILSM
jgi:phage repressor protein C with HTH and peptisase S24 domain